MNISKKNVINKISAMLVIMALTLTDIMPIGASIVSYAYNMMQTNNSNVEFAAYFKEDTEVSKVEKKVDEEGVKLSVDVSVKNEGYFDGKIVLNNNNFKFKTNQSSDYIKSVTETEVDLNQINAGSTVSLDLEIEPIVSASITSASLNKETEVNLTGSYVNSQNVENEKYVDINGKSKVEIDWKSSDNTNLEMESQVITNGEYLVNNENKKLVQILVSSKITNNNYPVKSTEITLDVPNGVENVEVFSRNNNATNSNVNFGTENYNYDKENGKLTISVLNADENNVSWNRNAQDTFIVTYIYNDDSTIENSNVKISGKVITYDSKELGSENNVDIDKKIDGIVTYNLQNEEESIYKGKIYTGESREYSTKVNMYVNYAGIASEIELNESAAKLKANDREINANIVYKSTTIDKNSMLNILGENGYITFKNADGTIIANITKDTEADENGKITVTYNNEKEINIVTSKPEKQGTIELENKKSIENSELTREVVNSLTSLKENITGQYDNTNANTLNGEMELKNTITKANFEVNTNRLSAVETNENVKMTVTLNNNAENYDLYQNPTIRIKLPKQVSKVSAKCKMLYGNGLELSTYKIVKENENYVMEIALNGTQTTYNTETVEGTTIIIYANIDVNKLATNSNEKITLNYTNGLATSFEDNGTVEKDVKIETIEGLITTNNIEQYNVETAGLDESKEVTLDVATGAKEATVKISTINNEGTAVDNVAIVGQLPTETDLGVTLGSEITITSNNDAKVYYSDVEDPTSDLNDVSNNWSENLTSSAKSYLITADSLDSAEILSAQYNISIPANLVYNLSAEEGYSVTYMNTKSSAEEEKNATTLLLTTGAGADLKTELKAYVGGNEIKDGDTIYSGEIVTYELDISNVGNAAAENVSVESTVPDGMKLVQYNKELNGNSIEDTASDEAKANRADEYVNDYYTELSAADGKLTKNYESISTGETKKISYDAKVETTETKEIKNSITVSFNNISNEVSISNNAESSDLTLNMYMMQRTSETLEVGEIYIYYLSATNNTNSDLKNIKIKINLNGMELNSVFDYTDETGENPYDITDNTINIDKITAGERKALMVRVTPTSSTSTLSISSVANTRYYSNIITENVKENSATISMESENEGDSVKAGDNIIYKISVANTGTDTMEDMEIQQQIPTCIEVQSVTANGENVEYTESQYAQDIENAYTISFKESINKDETLNIVVNTKADSAIEPVENVQIESLASAYYQGLLGKSETVNHVLLSYENANNISSSDDNNNGSSENGNNNENNSSNSDGKYLISGTAWLDQNEDGKRDNDEETLSGINVTIMNTKDNTTYSATTSESGFYSVTNIPNGDYIAIFDYDKDKYMTTIYQANGVEESRNSDVENVKLNLGEEKEVSATGTLTVNGKSITNIDIGLIEAKKYDFELSKTISKVVISNDSGTKTTEYQDSTLAKAEIKSKYLKGSTVVVEYSIKVKNAGEVAGYVKGIVDYKPTDLVFNSSLNPDWYQSGDYIYTNSLSNEKIEAGETKEIKLILTKTMTESNTGLVNNMAEISEDYNSLGLTDIDSTPANKASNEDDMSSANLIISVSTGAVFSYVTITLSIIVIIGAGAYIISKKIINDNVKF